MAGRTVERPCVGEIVLPPSLPRGLHRVGVVDAENHARQIRNRVDSCPHGDLPGQGDEGQDTP